MRRVPLPALHPGTAAAPPIALARADVHVWRFDLAPDTDRAARLYPLLDPAEQARAERFHFSVDRSRFVSAHGLLRCILGAYLATPPASIRFISGRHGKPALVDGHGVGLRFNLTHSGDIALLGIADQREIGVDIEAVRPGFAADRIAEQCFAPAEVAELRSLPLAQQDAAFFACWTRKEAFVKALGQGLCYPLQRFQVSLAPGEEPRLVNVDGDDRARQRWSLLDLGCLPTHRAALVVEGYETSLTLLTPQGFTPDDRYISPRQVAWNGV